MTTNSRRELLLLAFQMIESQMKACAKACVMDEYDSSLLALLHSTVQFGYRYNLYYYNYFYSYL